MQTLMNRIRMATGRSYILSDQRGLSTVEYVIILVLIAVLAIGGWKTLGTNLRSKIDSSGGEIEKLDQTNTSDSNNSGG